MIDWAIRQTVCGLMELPALCGEGITHLVSILDPDALEPEPFPDLLLQGRLDLRFHDVIVPAAGLTPPGPAHVEALLRFGRTLPGDDPAHLLVHCHMGVSRSTAAMAVLLTQAHPGAGEDAVFARIARIRPRAWPNSLFVALADEQLGRRGRLVDALRRFHARQLDAHPYYADQLREGGRGSEVDMAQL